MSGLRPRSALHGLLALLLLGGPSVALANSYIASIKYGGSCVASGAPIDLRGKGFGKKGPLAVVARSLPGMPTLGTTAWTDSAIRALAPSGPSGGSVTLALRDAKGVWHSNDAKYPVCTKPTISPPILSLALSAQVVPPSAPPSAKTVKVAPKSIGKPGFAQLAGGPGTPPQLAAVGPTGASGLRAGEELVVLLRRGGPAGEPSLSARQERHILGNLDLVLEVRQTGPGTRTSAALRELRLRPEVVAADRNDRLELLAEEGGNDPRRYATSLLGWKDQGGACGESARIGLVDTGVDQGHPTLRGANIHGRSFTSSESARDHGTAIAGLLLGRGGPMPGLVPKAELWVAAAVGLEGAGAARAPIAAIGRALDWLVGQEVQVINLSMGGPRNSVLHELVHRVLALDVVVVAAAGNGGPSAPPVYPAAQQGVLAVSAVDARSRAWRRSNQGSYVDLAAPGVDLWVARADGSSAFASGTSFAAPFVTAAIAALGGARAVERLMDDALDLGEPGPDPVFGRGLLQPPPACRRTPARATRP